MYQIGDFAVYRLLTLCRVDGTETPSFESDPTKQYYKLCPVFDNKSSTVIFVPTESSDGLRPLFALEDVKNALKELSSVKPTVYPAKKPPQLSAYYQELLSSCDVRKYLYLLKEVAVKEKSSAKRLSEIDSKFRTKTERLLCEELALLFKETPEDAKTRIYNAMN